MKLNLERLKQSRKDNELSQEDMVRALGWKSRSQYSKRESGSVSIGADELIAIAKILGYSKEEVGYFLIRTFPK
ncbi:helix-turn-helix domain-containing protein [Staphylococcus equorum]|uniref:helix-turn-helix domain-containing protein n=1 Tax=Staphylococcus equorum TaxID=246432 RepID=UPI00398AA644